VARRLARNNRGIPEAALDAAVLGALHKVVKDPATAWALIQERTERWRQEQALSVDVRKGLERKEKKLVAKIETLTAAIEDGQPVGNALKTRQAELDALRARLAADGQIVEADEEAFERMLLERAEQLRRHHGPALGGYAKSHPQTIDTAQTRAAMRALGIGKIVVTPTETGWTFAGDGNLAGLVSGGATRDSRRSPRSSSEELERDGLALHPESQVRHENQIGVRPAGEQSVAVAADDRGGVPLLERVLAQRGRGVLQEPRPESVVGFEGEETAVEPVGGRRRESIVELFRHTGHSTTALP